MLTKGFLHRNELLYKSIFKVYTLFQTQSINTFQSALTLSTFHAVFFFFNYVVTVYPYQQYVWLDFLSQLLNFI